MSQALISCAVLGALAIAMTVIDLLLSWSFSAGGYSETKAQILRWVDVIVFCLQVLVFALVTALFARSRIRRILAPVTVLVFLIPRCILLVVTTTTHQWHGPRWLVISLMACGFVLGWSVARRRSAATWFGLLPFAGFLAGYIWLDPVSRVVGSVDIPTYVSTVLVSLVTIVAFALSVLIFWGCDAIGMALSGGSRTTKESVPHTYSSPAPGAYPPPHGGQPYQHEGQQPAPYPGQPPVEYQRQPDQR